MSPSKHSTRGCIPAKRTQLFLFGAIFSCFRLLLQNQTFLLHRHDQIQPGFDHSDLLRPALFVQHEAVATIDTTPQQDRKDSFDSAALAELPISNVNCLTETFSNTTVLYRSCRYDFLCYHPKEGFVLYPSDQHWKLRSLLHENIYLSSIPKPVLAAAVPPFVDTHIWDESSAPFLREATFEPKELARTQSQSCLIQNDKIWIPVYPSWTECESHNVLWDFYLPIYTLLELFELQHHPIQVILLKRRSIDNRCLTHIYEFADMMGLARKDILDESDLVLSTNANLDQVLQQNNVLCSQVSLGGIGPHADHEIYKPMKTNITARELFKERNGRPPHGIRRGANLVAFRNHILKNLHLDETVSERSFRMVFSWLVPLELVHALNMSLPGVELEQMPISATIRQQMKMVQGASFFVVSLHQDKAAALFLPNDATLIVLDLRSRRSRNKDNQVSAQDWDLWTNYPLLRSHLFQGNDILEHVQAMLYLVQDEIDQQRSSNDIQRVMQAQTVKFANNHASVSLVGGKPPATRIHCIGEKIFPDKVGAARFRSCHMENMCFDLERSDFVVFASNNTQALSRFPNPYFHFSSVAKPMVPFPHLGQGYDSKIIEVRVESPPNITSYYKLDGVWLAYETFKGCNDGHVFWDLFLPLQTMLDMFGLNSEPLLLTRYHSKFDCARMTAAVEAALGYPGRTPRHDQLRIRNAQSRYVCASHSAWGFSWMNDHGVNHHGWKPGDLEWPFNLRRGGEMRHLRTRVLNSLGIPANVHASELPVSILFSSTSSRDKRRRIEFNSTVLWLQGKFPNVSIGERTMYEMELAQQIQVVAQSTIYVSACGGGSFPAFFLPKGAALILYGDKNMYLDFDVHNNFGLGRVHWLSLQSMENDYDVLEELIRDEIDVHRRGGRAIPVT